MKLFYTSILALSVAASGAWAESHSDSSESMDNSSDNASMSQSDNGMMDSAKLIRTRDITGGAIYTTNEANDEGWDGQGVFDSVGTDWNEIGEIEDIVLTHSGEFKGIVAEVGGFLDVGDKHVMIPVSDIRLVAVDDATYAYVTRLNEEDLESMEGVDEGFWN